MYSPIFPDSSILCRFAKVIEKCMEKELELGGGGGAYLAAAPGAEGAEGAEIAEGGTGESGRKEEPGMVPTDTCHPHLQNASTKVGQVCHFTAFSFESSLLIFAICYFLLFARLHVSPVVR